ncbi:MAG: hypothetical protein WAU07_04120 [Microgenomates group bacterium]
MTTEKVILAREFIRKKPYLVWYTKDYDNLSPLSIVEAVLNYGDWNDVLELQETLGIQVMNDIFHEIIQKKRVNLRPQTINYFEKYFEKYV